MVTGEPSLQNSLELALKSLRLLPSHASKEILVIIGALTTCDPGDINETIRVCFLACVCVCARVACKHTRTHRYLYQLKFALNISNVEFIPEHKVGRH